LYSFSIDKPNGIQLKVTVFSHFNIKHLVNTVFYVMQNKGGMQDYNYWGYGCYEITLEISCCKFPPANQLRQFWIDNKKSLVEYLKKANTGIRGIVQFNNGKLAPNLTVRFDSREPFFKTNKYGEYYRILLPGTYQLGIMFNCTSVYSQKVVIPSSGLLELNIKLPTTLYTQYAGIASRLDRYGLFCSVDKQPNVCDRIKNKL
jgi:hypothetical protein